MGVDEAFLEAGKKPGMEIWRIEKLKVVAQDVKTYGTFYSGDSYICLSTRKVESHLEWDIHFWLGTNTSQVLSFFYFCCLCVVSFIYIFLLSIFFVWLVNG